MKLKENSFTIGKSSINLGVKEVIISSILPKNNIALIRFIRQVNNSLREQCVLIGFVFISNDNISRTHLWTDGVHLKDLGTSILVGNLVHFLNRLILSKSNEYSWLYTNRHSKSLYGNTGILMSNYSLSPEIASDICNLGSVSSNWNSRTLKIMKKTLKDWSVEISTLIHI